MGNNCCNVSHNTHNTYISLVSDLYKKRKNNVHRYTLMMTQKNIKNVYENEKFDTIYISPKIESLLSPKDNTPFLPLVIQGGSACNSPTINNIGKVSLIVTMDNYIRYESDKSDDEFIII